MDLDSPTLSKVDKELTYAIPSYKFGDPPIIIKNMARIRNSLVAIPVGRLDLIPEDYEIKESKPQEVEEAIEEQKTKTKQSSNQVTGPNIIPTYTYNAKK